MFVAFVALLVAPAVALARRVAPMPVAALLVIVAAVPWYFFRKALGVPLVVDVATAAGLLFSAIRARAFRRPVLRVPLVTLVLLPLLFALVWLGWRAPAGNDVRLYGLFAIDFGNLVTVLSTVRASPMLPLSYVAGGGPLSYHWLYFTIPAALADAFGGSMPNANALVLCNLLVAMLLVETVASMVEDRRAALLVLFAPFTTYFYQAAAARLPLGPLAMPTRNHLLLSPLNSMLTFGNNTVALLLALAALLQLERWNRDGRLRDLLFGVTAVALMMGYSITLVFPLALTLVIWVLLGRVQRPWLALTMAVLSGVVVIGALFAIGVLASGSSRHIAVAFDRGQYLRMIVFGLVPLWGVALLAARRKLAIVHVLIASCILVPSLLYVAGSPTGGTDFSMKTASLLAIAFAPILAFDRRPFVAAALALLGVIQTAAYVLQFPYYRITHSTRSGVALPRDYVASLDWIREHTPRTAIVVDPHELENRDEIATLAIAERRVWLPTRYTNEFLIGPSADLNARVGIWRAGGEAMAREADVLVVPAAVTSPYWEAVHREGAWTVYRSKLH